MSNNLSRNTHDNETISTGDRSDSFSPPPWPTAAFVIQTAFVCEGIMILISNSVIILAFLTQRSIRSKSEYLWIVALAVSDMFIAAATLVGGLYRIAVLFGHTTAKFYQTVSVGYCLSWFFTFLAHWGFIGPSLFLFASTVDRFRATFWPITYYKSKGATTVPFLVVISLICFCHTSVAYIRAFEFKHLQTNSFCLAPRVNRALINPAESVLIFNLIIYLLYGAIVWKQRHPDHVFPTERNDRQNEIMQNRQRRVTNTVLTVVVFDFFLSFLPKLTAVISPHAWAYLPNAVFALHGFNSCINLLIYFKRDYEMRNAIKRLFGFTTKQSLQSRTKDRRQVGARSGLETNVDGQTY